MTYVDWEIKARTFGNCNCSYGYPCQFNNPHLTATGPVRS